MKNFNFTIVVLMILIAGISIAAVSSADTHQLVDGLNCTSNITQAMSDAGSQNKTMMLLFDQDSCYYCDLLKSDVLENKDVQKVLNDKFIVVDIDINKDSQLAADYKVLGTPIVAFLDSNNTEMNRIEGYVSADEFMDSIKEI